MTSIFQGLVEKAQGLVHFDVGVGDVASSFVTLPGVAGSYFDTPDSVDNSIRLDMILEADIAPDLWEPTLGVAIMAKSVGSTNQRSWRFELTAAGRLQFAWGTDGLTTESVSRLITPIPPDGSRHTVRMEADFLNRVVRFYIDGVQVGADSAMPTKFSMFDSTAPIEIGSINDGGAENFVGKIYSAKVYKGVTPEPYAYFDGIDPTHISTSSTVENSMRGAISVRVDAQLDSYAVGQTFIGKQVATGNQRSWSFSVLASGALSVSLNQTGSSAEVVSTVNQNLVAGQRYQLGVDYNPTDKTCVFFVNGVEVETKVTTTLFLFDASANVAVAAVNDGATNELVGIIYDAKVYKGVPNNPVDAYVALDGSSGTNLTTPDTVANSITGSITLEVDVAPTDWELVTQQAFISKYLTTGNQRSYRLGIDGTGDARVQISVDGATAITLDQALPAWTGNERHSIRAEINIATQELTYFVGDANYTNMVQLGTPVPFTAASIFDSTIAPEIGSINSGGSTNLDGIVYNAKVYDGITAPNSPTDVAINGNFATLDGWDAAGSWALNIGFASGGPFGQNTLLTNDGEVVNGQTYTVTWTMTNYLGSLGIQVALGGVTGAAQEVDGTFVEVITAGGTAITFENLGGAQCEVSAVSVVGGNAGPPITATLVLDMDPYPYIQGDPTFVSSLGNLWNLEGAAVAVSPIDDGLRVHMDPYPALQGGATFPLDADSVPVAIFPGDAGDYFSEPDSVVNSIAGDIDIRWEGTLDDWAPATFEVLIAKYLSGVGQVSWSFNIQANGDLRLVMSTDGTAIITPTVGNPAFVAGSFHTLRVTWSQSGQVCTFYESFDGGASWIQISTPQAAAIPSIFDSDASIEVGARQDGAFGGLHGTCSSAQVYDGIDGTLAVDFDPATLQGWTLNGNVSVTGVWTVNGNAIATSPIDDGLKSSFEPAVIPNSSVGGEVWTSNGNITLLVSEMMRHLYWNPISAFEASVYASVGEVEASVGAGGLSFDAGSRLRIAYGGNDDKVLLPGGMTTDPTGALIVGGPPDLIHQGVGLTNECYVSDGVLAPLLADSLAWFDETSIEDTSPGSDFIRVWHNKGTGGTGFDLGTIVGAAGNLTRMANSWARLPGEVGDAFQTPNVALNEITANLDVRWFGRPDAWNINQTFFSHSSTPAAQSWELQGRNTKVVRLTLSQDGTVTDLIDSPTLPFDVGGEVGGVRATVDFGTQLVQFYTSTDGVNWTVLGAPVATILTALFATTAPVVVGARNSGNSLPMTGYTIYAQAYRGIYNGGPLGELGPDIVINGDFEDGGTGWSPGGGWTIASSKADAINGNDLLSLATTEIGKTYEFIFTIVDFVSGTVRWQSGASAGIEQTGNGTYTEIVLASGTSFALRGNGNFNGSVDNVSLREISAELAIRFDPSDAALPQTVWTDPVLGNDWTPKGDAFVNTTGKDVVNAAGGVGLETTSNNNTALPITVFMAGKITDLAAGTTQVYHDARISSRALFQLNSVSSWIMFQTATILLTGGDTAPHVFTEQYNGDVTSELTISDIGNTVGDVGNNQWVFGTLFMGTGGANTMNGWIGEYIVFDRTLTAEEISIMQQYLENKWT